jgi:hypothetical protein
MTNLSMIYSLILFASISSVVHADVQPSPTHVPIILADDGRYLLPCSFGVASGQCVLDTGSVHSWVSENPTSAAFKKIRTRSAKFEYGSAIVTDVIVDSFKIGDLIDISSAVVTRSDAYEDLKKYLGVIGADVLFGRNLVFDFLSPETGMYLQELKDSLNGQSNSAKLYPPDRQERNLIVVDVQVGGNHLRAMVDSHDQTEFTQSFIDSHPELFIDPVNKLTPDIGGHTIVSKFYRLATSVCVAGSCAQPLYEVDAIDSSTGAMLPGIDMILGRDFIFYSKWQLDYTHGLYSVQIRRPLSWPQ